MLGSILGGIGSVVSGLFGKSAAEEQAQLQKQFAKNAIQWKVEDAKKAGVHPLYALGANTVSYSPVQTGGLDMSWLSDMGQEIDRSRMATSEAPTRKLADAMASLGLEKAGLENDLLRAEIAKTRAQVGPAMPSVAPRAGLVPEEVNPPQRTAGVNIGTGVKSNPYFTDGQTLADRYGDSEILGMASAIVNGLADAYWNWPSGQPAKARDYGAYLAKQQGQYFRKSSGW